VLLKIAAAQQPTLPPLTTLPWNPPSEGWDRNDDLPNPQTHHSRCQQLERSWLCDPNSKLTNEQCQCCYIEHSNSHTASKVLAVLLTKYGITIADTFRNVVNNGDWNRFLQNSKNDCTKERVTNRSFLDILADFWAKRCQLSVAMFLLGWDAHISCARN